MCVKITSTWTAGPTVSKKNIAQSVKQPPPIVPLHIEQPGTGCSSGKQCTCHIHAMQKKKNVIDQTIPPSVSDVHVPIVTPLFIPPHGYKNCILEMSTSQGQLRSSSLETERQGQGDIVSDWKSFSLINSNTPTGSQIVCIQ